MLAPFRLRDDPTRSVTRPHSRRHASCDGSTADDARVKKNASKYALSRVLYGGQPYKCKSR